MPGRRNGKGKGPQIGGKLGGKYRRQWMSGKGVGVRSTETGRPQQEDFGFTLAWRY